MITLKAYLATLWNAERQTYEILEDDPILDALIVGQQKSDTSCPKCHGKPISPNWNAARFDRITSCIINPEEIRSKPCDVCGGIGQSSSGMHYIIKRESFNRFADLINKWSCPPSNDEEIAEIASVLLGGNLFVAKAIGRMYFNTEPVVKIGDDAFISLFIGDTVAVI